MLGFKIDLKYHLWDGVNISSVTKFLEELSATKKRINDISSEYQWNLYGSKKLIEEINSAIDERIELYNFYLDQLNREQEETFNKWVFTKKEDIKPLYEWVKPKGDQWTKTNGRVKAKIVIDRSTIMAKITLNYENDSKYLKFYDSYSRSKDETISHAKNEDSIEDRIKIMKDRADFFLKSNEYPYGSSQLKQLKELMRIE